MRRARRTYQTCSSPKRIGVLLVGLCSLYLGLGSELGVGGSLTGSALAQPKQSPVQNNDAEVPGSRGNKVPSDLNQIDEGPPQATPVRPAPPPKPAVTCCTPGKDCPCTPGVDCPCTPGVDCPCTLGKDCACTPGVNCPAKPPQRSDFCVGKNCPCVGASCKHCTPGKDCPCTPFIDCPVNEGVLFDKDSADIRPDTRENLVKFATGLKQLPLTIVEDRELVGLNRRDQDLKREADSRIRIEGHVSSDEGGSPAAQARLAVMRANAVKKALIEAGLPEAYIASTRGYGALCRITIRANSEEDVRFNRAVQFVYNRDRTGCAFPEASLRPSQVPDLSSKRPKGPKAGGSK